MKDTRYDMMEQLNAQIDVWIDQEEFDLVINAFKPSPFENKHFFDAFSHENCTFLLDADWSNLLDVNSRSPLQEFRLHKNWISFSPSGPESGDYELNERWAKFFWAKLLRAQIQQKGSDCYFNRLDQVVFFLEGNQPIAKRPTNNKDYLTIQTNKLAVINLLEMAASGLGPDQRSFSERARRLLREHFDGKENAEKRNFFDFYDLLARFSIGLGFQHEEQRRKAVREFNLIIKKLRGTWTKEGELIERESASDKKKANYVHKRHGLDLLYLPAVLGRANLEIKLQIAYHAIETLDDYWIRPQSYYLTAKRACLLAEANRLLGDRSASESNLHEVANILIKKCHANNDNSEELPVDWLELLKKITADCKHKWANIQDRLLDTYVAVHFEKLKTISTRRDSLKQIENLRQICEILPLYLQSSKWQDANRKGYLESVSIYLGWLAKFKSEDNDVVKQIRLIAKDIYDKNQHLLNPKRQNCNSKNSKCCFCCTNLDINLERLVANHYQQFAENMQKFYNTFNTDYAKDSIRFEKKLFDIEINNKEDSAFQKRKMALNKLDSNWCKGCVDISLNSNSFSGLLTCAKSSNIRDHSSEKKLDSEDYEHLMKHWEERFLRHLETESVHLPYSSDLHILGLQRWNSTSPAIGRSLGGGYLIYHTNNDGQVDLGIAVDPGFDFVRNLFHLGFSLSDIDIVLLSHAHLDHTRDFESLVTLCLELHKRDPKNGKRRLHTIMTLGVYRRLSHIFESPGLREFVEPYILDIKKDISPEFIKPYINDLTYYDSFSTQNKNPAREPEADSVSPQFVFQKISNSENNSNNDRAPFRFKAVPPSEFENKAELHLSVTATRAYHNDFSEYSDSFGFKIAISDNNRIIGTIGYTGDTSWSPDIIEQYKNCNALLIHIGSLIDHNKKSFEDYKESKDCWNLVREKNHPYLFGLLQFLTEIAKSDPSVEAPLVLLSEFGEELRGRIRLDLLTRLSDHYNCEDTQKKIPLLPLDVGLDIILKHKPENNSPSFKVKCLICDIFVRHNQVDFETYGHDEALYCVCKTCRRSTPHNVLQDRLRDLYEVARPLQSYKKHDFSSS